MPLVKDLYTTSQLNVSQSERVRSRKQITKQLSREAWRNLFPFKGCQILFRLNPEMLCKKSKDLSEKHQYVTPLKLDPRSSYSHSSSHSYISFNLFLYELPTSVTSSLSSRALLYFMLTDKPEPFLTAGCTFFLHLCSHLRLYTLRLKWNSKASLIVIPGFGDHTSKHHVSFLFFLHLQSGMLFHQSWRTADIRWFKWLWFFFTNHLDW